MRWGYIFQGVRKAPEITSSLSVTFNEESMHCHNFEENEWPFNFSIGTEVFTTKQVMYEGHPINLVLHDDENDWQFLCGTTNKPRDGMIVCMGCLFEKFRYLEMFFNLEPGWQASREKETSAWLTKKME